TEVRQVSPTHILLRIVNHASHLFRANDGFVSVDELAALKGIDVTGVDDDLKDAYVRRELIQRGRADFVRWRNRGTVTSQLRFEMANEGKKHNASEITEDVDESLEEAEGGSSKWRYKRLQAKRHQTVDAEGVQKLLEQHLAREAADKKARAAEAVKSKAKRAIEGKAIAVAATKAADEAAKEAAEASE
ncbi:hypothetical protein DYB28_013525, partial [Aphanomyces astaci]